MNLEKNSIEVIQVGENRINIKNLLKKLASKKIKTILVEGGGTINWEFIKEGFVDEIIVTVSPYLIGGTDAISFVGGKGFSKINQSPKLKLKKITRLGNEVILHYT